jgi:preprotein translocase subunit YajC
MGTQFLAAAEATKSTGSSSSLLIIIVIFGALMIFMFRSQSRRKRATQDTQRQVVDGARIRTTFGVYGTVIEGDDRNVIVEVAPGTRIKMLRQAIAAVVPDDEPDGVNTTMPDMGSDQTTPQSDDRSDLTI